jgi:hypothetical protein
MLNAIAIPCALAFAISFLIDAFCTFGFFITLVFCTFPFFITRTPLEPTSPGDPQPTAPRLDPAFVIRPLRCISPELGKSSKYESKAY